MPKYTSHTTLNCLVAVPLAYLGFFWQNLFSSDLVVTAGLSFLISTLLLSPDLDLSHSTPTKNWGILKFIWYGYPKVFSHRGLSHSIFLSAVTKIVYLWIFLGLGFFLFTTVDLAFQNHSTMEIARISGIRTYHKAKDLFEYLVDHKRHLIAFAVGLILSDWIHIVVDRVYTATKKRRFRF